MNMKLNNYKGMNTYMTMPLNMNIKMNLNINTNMNMTLNMDMWHKAYSIKLGGVEGGKYQGEGSLREWAARIENESSVLKGTVS
jgi:hypothetical protein